MNNRVNLDKKLLNKKEKTEIKNFLKKKKVNLKKNFNNANINFLNNHKIKLYKDGYNLYNCMQVNNNFIQI